jgi:hypothetical protein
VLPRALPAQPYTNRRWARGVDPGPLAAPIAAPRCNRGVVAHLPRRAGRRMTPSAAIASQPCISLPATHPASRCGAPSWCWQPLAAWHPVRWQPSMSVSRPGTLALTARTRPLAPATSLGAGSGALCSLQHCTDTQRLHLACCPHQSHRSRPGRRSVIGPRQLNKCAAGQTRAPSCEVI